MRINLDAMDNLGVATDAPVTISANAEEEALRKAIEQSARPQKPKHEQAEIVPRKVDLPTLSENEERDGYELRFPAAINKALSTQLTLNGWKFTARQWKDPLWYVKRSPTSRQFALAIIKITCGVSELKAIESGT